MRTNVSKGPAAYIFEVRVGHGKSVRNHHSQKSLMLTPEKDLNINILFIGLQAFDGCGMNTATAASAKATFRMDGVKFFRPTYELSAITSRSESL
jgi:hypothetical protein